MQISKLFTVMACMTFIIVATRAETNIGKGVQIINISKNTTTVNDTGSKVNTGIDFGDSGPPAGLVKGSNKTAVRTIEIPEFTGLIVKNGMNVILNAGAKTPGVKISGDDNIIALLKAEVKQKTLTLKYSKSFSTERELHIEISATDLEKISAASGARVQINGLNTKNFSITGTQAAKITAQGKVSRLDLTLSSAASFDGAKLNVENAQVKLSYAARACLNVSGKVTGTNNFGSCTFVNKPRENLIKSANHFDNI